MGELEVDMVKGSITLKQEKDIDEIIKQLAPENLVGMFSDQVQKYRFMNQVKILKKVKEICEINKLEPRQVAPKFLLKFLEKSGLEENTDLQERWANLMVNQSVNTNVDIYYMDILDKLEPIDAVILEQCFHSNINTRETVLLRDLTEYMNKEGRKIEEFRIKIIIRKLISLQLFNTGVSEGVMVDGDEYLVDTVDNFRWSELGIDFMKKIQKIDI